MALIFLFAAYATAITEQEEQIAQTDPLMCHHRVLQYYGFEGWSTAKVPPPEEQDGGKRFCQDMEYTCCSRDDFLKAVQMWKVNLWKIKGYLTKIFRIIQKIVMIQSSFIQVAQKLSVGAHPDCGRIDTTFFNPPVAFDKIYAYLKTGFQAMAYAQKGFYCTLCNVKNHKFMMLPQSFSRIMIAMSQQSCDDLIHYFKEFLMYKIYYLDPFIKHADYMFKCYDPGFATPYEFSYQSPYQEMKACFESGGPVCGNVCREFQFGKSSELFMGDLGKYEAFLSNLERFAGEVGISLEMENQELYIPDYTFDSPEFFKQETEFSIEEQEDLNFGRISDHLILVFKDGIDIFGTARTSNFFLTDQETTMEKTRIYNTNIQEGLTTSLLGDGKTGEMQKTIEDVNEEAREEEQEIIEAEKREEEEKLERLGPEHRPSPEQLEELREGITRIENKREQYTEQTGRINDFNPDSGDDMTNEFGSIGRIENSVGVWVSGVVSLLFWLMV